MKRRRKNELWQSLDHGSSVVDNSLFLDNLTQELPLKKAGCKSLYYLPRISYVAGLLESFQYAD